MSCTLDNELSVIQKAAEDAAYTFKGMHKTASILEWGYRVLVIWPIGFSIVCLGFDSELSQLTLKILAAISIFLSTILLYMQTHFSKIEAYRELGNKFKSIYDDLRRRYHKGEREVDDAMQYMIDQANQQTNLYPINYIAYRLTRAMIDTEMDLTWIRH